MTPPKKQSKNKKPIYRPSKKIQNQISKWEGAAMYKDTIDPLTGKMAKKNLGFDQVADSFVNVMPNNVREWVLSNSDLADSLFSFAYNVGAGKFKERTIPAIEAYLNGQGTVKDITNAMWAHGDKKLRGLRNRRIAERAMVEKAISDMNPNMSLTPYRNDDYNYYRANQLNYSPDELGHMPTRDYVTGMYLKRPTHNTVMKGIVSDLAEGYNPYYNSQDGQLYSDTWMKPINTPQAQPQQERIFNNSPSTIRQILDQYFERQLFQPILNIR